MMSFVRDVGRPFFVDPMVYMFTLPPEAVRDSKTGEIRPSLSTLAKRYGSVISTNFGKAIIAAKDISDRLDVIDELTQNVLEYQRTKLLNGEMHLFNPYFSKYANLEEDGENIQHVTNSVTPWVLIPPFFYFENYRDDWYQATLACARMAERYRQPGEKIFPVIFTGRLSLENPDTIKRIIDDFADKNFDGIFLWLNAVDEDATTQERLAGLVQLISGLNAKNKPVYKLYGGYFSSTLHHSGLSGFSCSLNYKTSRNIFLYRWKAAGPPQPKFYIPRLHRAYPLEEAGHLLKMFPFLQCDCRLCSEAYVDDPHTFTEEMKKPSYCERHFLNARRRELQLVQAGLPSILEELEDTLQQMKGENSGTRHLSKWQAVLQGKILPSPSTRVWDARGQAKSAHNSIDHPPFL